ncbi:hypothetical protein [Helicobacter pylori]|nr:hypothetical protein [Helicobacter pylori]
MISFFALYYGVIFENRDKLVPIIVVLWGMCACFWRWSVVLRFFKIRSF